jgi:threonine dehydratase
LAQHDSEGLLSREDIAQARQRIVPFVRHTPLVRSAYLSELVRAEVWLKLECLQPTGSFKVRGALNKIGLLTPDQKALGIVTGSAGNHGLGVAYAAQAWGVSAADIFIPVTAPQAKADKLRRFPVNVHQQGTTYEDAHQAAEAFAHETGATYVQAYNDLDVIAGQGTMALEILEDLPAPDVLLVPVGGGGLIAGVSTAIKAERSTCQVVGVQPEASPAALLSLRDGMAYDPYSHEPTIADGLAGGFGSLPLSVSRKHVGRVLLCSEYELRQAIFCLVDQHQLIVEASGAIAIVPLLAGKLDVAGQTVVCILSGSNIATALLCDILNQFVT